MFNEGDAVVSKIHGSVAIGRGARMLMICGALLALPGCAAVALTAGGLAAGAGVNHTLNGIAYKTFNNSLDEMRGASLVTLAQMDMEVVMDEQTEEGWEINATASEREIDIVQDALARNDVEINAQQVRQTILDIVFEVQRRYWDLVFSRRNLEAQRSSLKLAQDFLADNKVRVELNVLAPVELIQSETQVKFRPSWDCPNRKQEV